MKHTITMTGNAGLEKSTTHTVAEIIENTCNSVEGTTIIKKPTGDITVISFDAGRGLTEKISAFDMYILAIEGMAEIIINGKSKIVTSGMGIIIPANAQLIIKTTERFKMLRTIIKSGYEL